MTGFCDAGVVLWLCDICYYSHPDVTNDNVFKSHRLHYSIEDTVMRNIGEQQIIIECPNTIFHLYIDSEDELSKVKVFMNNMKYVDSLSLHDIYNWCNRQHVQYTTTFNYDSKMTWTEMIKSYIFYFRQKLRYVNNSDRMIET